MSECVLDAVMNDEMNLEMVDDGLSMVVLQGCKWKAWGSKSWTSKWTVGCSEDSRPV